MALTVLAPRATVATNYFGGVLNAPLGDAVLTVQNDTMIVDNLGHDGNDGFRIDAGQVNALDILYLQAIEEIMKHQTCILSSATSQYAPFGVASVGGLMGGSAPFVYADFTALGSTQSVMQVRDGGGILLETRRLANAAHVDLNSLFPEPKTNSIYLYQYQQGADFTWWRVCTPCLVCTEQLAVVERTICINALDVRRPVRFINGLEIKSQGVDPQTSLVLSSESLGLLGHFHQALGQARFDTTGGSNVLAVANLGSNGNDGVAIKLGPNKNRLKVKWDGLDPAGAAPPGASFTMGAKGSFTGGVKQTLGSMKIQKLATGMTLVNDFTGIGSQSALILVMRNGAQVASFRLNHNTPLPFTGGWPRTGTVGPRLSDIVPPYGPICFYEDWPIDVTISMPGGNVVGNQIRVLIDDVPQQYAALSTVEFTLSHLPRFALIGEESSQAGLIFDGLVHAPLGGATLQIEAASGELRVSGISSNGTDGVRIFTGGGGGATTKLGVFDPDALPSDAWMCWSALDPTDVQIEGFTVRNTPNGGAVFAEFSGFGAPTATVALYSNDTLVAYATGVPATTPVFTFGGGGGGLPLALNPCILHPEDCYGVSDITIWQPDPVGSVIPVVTLPGRSPARGTRVTIQPDPLPVAPATFHVKEIQITGKNLGMMNIKSEGLVYYGLEHQAVGQAQYRFDMPDAFAMDNLGSSGNDGVDVQIQRLVQSSTAGGPIIKVGPPRNGYSADWVALNPQPLPPGGGPLLTLRAVGDWNGQPGSMIGSLSVRGAGGSLQLVPDFSGVGAQMLRVELGNGCQYVSSFSTGNAVPVVSMTEAIAVSGTSFSADPDDDWCGTRPPQPPGPPPWWWWVRWPRVVEVTTPSGEHFQVDRVRVSPAAVTGRLDSLSQISYRVSGYSELQFTREATERRGLNFDGNQHFPLGNATLTKTATGQLRMDNLGSSGNDGVEIALGRADYCEVASPSLPLPPLGNSCHYDFRAVLDGISDRTAVTVDLQATATGTMAFSPDLSPLGATRYTLLVFNGDTLVSKQTNQPSASYSIGGGASSFALSLQWKRTAYVNGSVCYIKHSVKSDSPAQPLIIVAPGPGVNGDRVLVVPEDPTRAFGPQNRVLLTANLIHPEPKFIMLEKLGLFGNGHTGLGIATLQASDGLLTVGNLGTNGNDGVSIDLEKSRNALVSLAPIDFSAVQGPHPWPWMLQAVAFGEFGAVPNHDLGSLRFTAVQAPQPSPWIVEADFTAVGATTHIVEVWSNGTLMQRVAGHTGVVATVSLLPSAIGKLGGVDPTVLPCFIAQFSAVGPIAIGGGATVNGDELRVLTENPTATIGPLQSLSLLASGFDSFAIVNEMRTPVLLPPMMQLTRLPGGDLQLSVPTIFGHYYAVETVDALGPQPLPWTTLDTFVGDGSVKSLVIPATGPRRFFRARVE